MKIFFYGFFLRIKLTNIIIKWILSSLGYGHKKKVLQNVRLVLVDIGAGDVDYPE